MDTGSFSFCFWDFWDIPPSLDEKRQVYYTLAFALRCYGCEIVCWLLVGVVWVCKLIILRE